MSHLPPPGQAVRDLLFRELQPGDGDALKALLSDIWSQDGGEGLFRRLGDPDAYADRQLGDPEVCCVGDWSGEVAAFGAWRQDEGIAVVDVCGSAERLAKWKLAPPLLEHMVRRMREEGICGVEATVLLTGTAIQAMYEGLGFRMLGKQVTEDGEIICYHKRLSGRGRESHRVKL
jgi:hypothetical protein